MKNFEVGLIPSPDYYELYCRCNLTFNTKKFKSSPKPKISIVISLYNREQYIKYALNSVQNQELTDIETIVVDDFSTDNSVNAVKEFQKYDSRIILLENKQNKGALYSKSIGALHAKGEFINSLDSDDMFCNRNYLDIAYKEIISNNYDFVISKVIYLSEVHKYLELRYSSITVLYTKLIKKEVYRNSILKIGKRILNLKIDAMDDEIVSLFLLQNRKYKYLNILGFAHIMHFAPHVFSNRFKTKKNSKIYCGRLLKTIEGLYIINHPGGINFGKTLLNRYFINGECTYITKLKYIKRLNKSNEEIKKIYHSK